MIDTKNIDKSVEDQMPAGNGMSDSTVDAIAALVVITCLVAIAATFISGGLA